MQTKFDRPSLIEVLVRQQAVTDSAAHEVLKRRGDKPGDIGPLLVSAGLITEEQLAQATAEQYGLPYDSLSNVEVDPKFYQTIPVKLMQRYPFIPIAEQDGFHGSRTAGPAPPPRAPAAADTAGTSSGTERAARRRPPRHIAVRRDASRSACRAGIR